MEDYWYVGCQAKELLSTPVAITILKHPLALFRDAQGNPAAVEDRCAHRGAPLTHGTVERGCLACPYHGWRYAADGSVAEIPAMPKDCRIPEHFRIPAHACLEQDGFIWVCMSGRASPAPRRFSFLGE